MRQMTPPLRPKKYTMKKKRTTHPVQLPARKVVELPHGEAVDHRPRDGLHRGLHHLRAVLDRSEAHSPVSPSSSPLGGGGDAPS